MKDQQKKNRKKIKDYNYEIDDHGRLFSTQYHPGYGFGWQMMPGKPGRAVRPQYTLTRNKEYINFSVQKLVSEHFIPAVEFDVAWYRKTREEAKKNNALLRANWLKGKRQANAIEVTVKNSIKILLLVEEARKRAKEIELQEEKAASRFKPWANAPELNSSCRMYEAACETGFDYRDSNFYPFS